MNKILKNILTVIGILLFCLFLKSGVKFYNIMGVIGLYWSVYYFMTLNSEGIENFYLKEILVILLTYNLQKMGYILHKEVYKNRLFLYTNIIMICFFSVIFIYNLSKDKKISLKNILDLGYEFLLISIPFYIIKGRGMQPIILISMIILTKIFIEKKYTFNRNIKKIYFSVIMLILFSSTSFIGNVVTESQINGYEHFVCNLIFLLSFLQIKLSNEEMKKIMNVMLSSSMILIVPIIVKLLEVKTLGFRVGHENPNIWAMKGAVWTVIFLYLILFKNKKECILFYILYIIGVYASGSRGGIIAMILANIILCIYRYKSQIKVLITITFITMLLVFGILKTNNRISYTIKLIKNEKKIDNSSAIRILVYKEAIEQFKEKPINGIGFLGYESNAARRHPLNNDMTYIERSAYIQNHAHNNMIDLLSSLGVLGFVSYISMIFFICKTIYFTKKPEGVLILCLIFMYELYGIVEDTLFHYHTQAFLFLLIGLFLAQITPKIDFSKKEKLE